MPFVLLEGLFWLVGLGAPRLDHDPFAGFRDVHPLFVLSDDGERYEIAPSRLVYFRPDSFAANKGADEFRIFCLGGSTVQGRPFALETSFTSFLELTLGAAEPNRSWQVVNCGGVSYASYRLVPILEEVLEYEPDLIILYTGHNEFLEDRTYGHIKRMPGVVAWPAQKLAATRTYRVMQSFFAPAPAEAPVPDRPVLPDEVDALLEHHGGLDQYHRDEKWRADIVDHFEYNVRRMVALADEAGVPLLLVNPVCNLRDCPPFKNQHRDGLTADELRRWEDLIAQAAEHQGTNTPRTVELLRQAVAIDDQHAGLHFALARSLDTLGRLEAAHPEYVAAKENDICPLRVLEPMNEAIVQIARDTATPLVDVRRMYEKISEGGIPGGLYLIDHVHPSIEGHQLIADLIASQMSLLGYLQPQPDWRQRRNEVFRQRLDSLDDLYYSKGQQRLEMLRCWTQGKAGRVPGTDQPMPESGDSTE